MTAHGWRAVGALGAMVGALTIFILDQRGYRQQAQVLAIGGILAGGITAAITIYHEGERTRAATPLPAAPNPTAGLPGY